MKLPTACFWLQLLLPWVLSVHLFKLLWGHHHLFMLNFRNFVWLSFRDCFGLFRTGWRFFHFWLSYHIIVVGRYHSVRNYAFFGLNQFTVQPWHYCINYIVRFCIFSYPSKGVYPKLYPPVLFFDTFFPPFLTTLSYESSLSNNFFSRFSTFWREAGLILLFSGIVLDIILLESIFRCWITGNLICFALWLISIDFLSITFI